VALSKQQESRVIDFLKRWGIDSPELLVEMADHYCMAAEEGMREGKAFEEVLNGWKTRKNYLELRKIQTEFEQVFKKRWMQAHIEAFRQVFLSHQTLVFAAAAGLVHLSFQWGLAPAISLIFLIKAFGLGILFLISIGMPGKFSRILELRRTPVFWLGNYIIAAHFVASDGFGGDEPYIIPQFLIFTSLAFDFATYNLWRRIRETFKGIVDEYFVKPNIPQR
jgi:hypothetical protein